MTAVDCLPTVQLAAGYDNTLTYDGTEVTTTNGVAGTPTSGSYTETNTVAGTTTLDGVTVTTVRSTDTSVPGNINIYYHRISGNQFQDYGNDTVSASYDANNQVIGSFTRAERYSSPSVIDFGAAAGQAQSYSYTRTDTYSGGAPASATSVSGSYTFIGLESVVTPLGTFTSACKFAIAETVTESSGIAYTNTTTGWLARGSGLPIKLTYSWTSSFTPNVVSSGTQVLSAGTVNGVALVAQ